jgi:hypothetical protein
MASSRASTTIALSIIFSDGDRIGDCKQFGLVGGNTELAMCLNLPVASSLNGFGLDFVRPIGVDGGSRRNQAVCQEQLGASRGAENGECQPSRLAVIDMRSSSPSTCRQGHRECSGGRPSARLSSTFASCPAQSAKSARAGQWAVDAWGADFEAIRLFDWVKLVKLVGDAVRQAPRNRRYSSCRVSGRSAITCKVGSSLPCPPVSKTTRRAPGRKAERFRLQGQIRLRSVCPESGTFGLSYATCKAFQRRPRVAPALPKFITM